MNPGKAEVEAEKGVRVVADTAFPHHPHHGPIDHMAGKGIDGRNFILAPREKMTQSRCLIDPPIMPPARVAKAFVHATNWSDVN